MRAVGHALRAMGTNPTSADVAEQGLKFLANLAWKEENKIPLLRVVPAAGAAMDRHPTVSMVRAAS
jgi:hypothetical protein